jgi:hypothetical protein
MKANSFRKSAGAWYPLLFIAANQQFLKCPFAFAAFVWRIKQVVLEYSRTTCFFDCLYLMDWEPICWPFSL